MGSDRSAGSVRVGVVDTGVNPWHSHVRGRVRGCRIFRDPEGLVREANLLGRSFACARVSARAARDPQWAHKALDRTGGSDYIDDLTGD